MDAPKFTGGLGSMISEIIAEYELSSRIVRCGIKTCIDGKSGSLSYMRAKYGLSLII